LKPNTSINVKYKALEFHVFGTALVIKLKSKDLVARHNYLMDTYKATYDYPSYEAHIILSYNIEDFDYKSLSISEFPKNLTFVKEYCEDLELEKEYK
jgi:hypothetical protein